MFEEQYGQFLACSLQLPLELSYILSLSLFFFPLVSILAEPPYDELHI